MDQHLAFSLSLHHQLAPSADEAFCWSPYSIASALGLAATAVTGTARDELVGALREEPGDLVELLDAAARLDGGAAAEEPELRVANTLWADDDLPLRESYLAELRRWPGGSVNTAPLRAAPEKARELINSDVSRTTRELVPELLAPGTIDSDTIATLVNALYLKVSWRQAFDTHATAARPFHAPGGTADVPTMHVTRRFGYRAAHGWQVVSLPADGEVEALVLLPDGDLGAAESALTADRLAALVSPAEQRLDLFLPKFEVTGDADLERPLGAVGVRTLFTPAADFAPLTGASLRISAIVHQSVLRVDESGLEGAAATAAMMRLTSVVREPDPIPVHVDRPFLFLVRHQRTGALYFLARVVDPG